MTARPTAGRTAPADEPTPDLWLTGPMPARIVVQLKAERRGAQLDDIGPAVHAELLARVDALSPRVAEALHDEAHPDRPFSLASRTTGSGTLVVEIGVIADPLVELVVAALDGTDSVTLLGQRLRIERGDVFPLPWPDVLDPDEPSPTWEIELRSPTMVRIRRPGVRSEIVRPLPEPNVVYPVLWKRLASAVQTSGDAAALDAWSRLADVDTWLDRVVITRFDLRSDVHLVETRPRKVRYVGATGTIRYRLLDPKKAEIRALGACSLFAQVCGVGDKTVQGMGWARSRPIRTRGTSPGG